MPIRPHADDEPTRPAGSRTDPTRRTSPDSRTRSSGSRATMRISAASALGILVDERDVDPLFEIDAHTNPYGLTSAGRTLVAVY